MASGEEILKKGMINFMKLTISSSRRTRKFILVVLMFFGLGVIGLYIRSITNRSRMMGTDTGLKRSSSITNDPSKPGNQSCQVSEEDYRIVSTPLNTDT